MFFYINYSLEGTKKGRVNRDWRYNKEFTPGTSVDESGEDRSFGVSRRRTGYATLKSREECKSEFT